MGSERERGLQQRNTKSFEEYEKNNKRLLNSNLNEKGA